MVIVKQAGFAPQRRDGVHACPACCRARQQDRPQRSMYILRDREASKGSSSFDQRGRNSAGFIESAWHRLRPCCSNPIVPVDIHSAESLHVVPLQLQA